MASVTGLHLGAPVPVGSPRMGSVPSLAASSPPPADAFTRNSDSPPEGGHYHAPVKHSPPWWAWGLTALASGGLGCLAALALVSPATRQQWLEKLPQSWQKPLGNAAKSLQHGAQELLNPLPKGMPPPKAHLSDIPSINPTALSLPELQAYGEQVLNTVASQLGLPLAFRPQLVVNAPVNQRNGAYLNQCVQQYVQRVALRHNKPLPSQPLVVFAAGAEQDLSHHTPEALLQRCQAATQAFFKQHPQLATAKQGGKAPPPLGWEDLHYLPSFEAGSLHGHYNSNTHSIWVNPNQLHANKPTELMNTLAHECWHAYEQVLRSSVNKAQRQTLLHAALVRQVAQGEGPHMVLESWEGKPTKTLTPPSYSTAQRKALAQWLQANPTALQGHGTPPTQKAWQAFNALSPQQRLQPKQWPAPVQEALLPLHQQLKTQVFATPQQWQGFASQKEATARTMEYLSALNFRMLSGVQCRVSSSQLEETIAQYAHWSPQQRQLAQQVVEQGFSTQEANHFRESTPKNSPLNDLAVVVYESCAEERRARAFGGQFEAEWCQNRLSTLQQQGQRHATEEAPLHAQLAAHTVEQRRDALCFGVWQQYQRHRTSPSAASQKNLQEALQAYNTYVQTGIPGYTFKPLNPQAFL